MITQCPDCQTTFRVSVEVLEQAGGRVRCGGCGNAFSAHEHLSQDDDDQAEEFTSKQDKQLLETLDKLPGPEVEIEDTGVEWRVLEVPAGEEAYPDTTGSTNYVVEGDDVISGSPAVHSRRGDLPQPVPDTQESLDLSAPDPLPTKASQRRYDDNTVLPENFGDEEDLDELPFLEAASPKRRTSDHVAIQDTPEFDEAQADLGLGETGEWAGLLDEVDDEEAGAEGGLQASAENESDSEDEAEPPPEDEAEPETLAEEAADDEPPGEDMPSGINKQFLQQAEEMGLDTGNYPTIDEDEYEADDDTAADEDESDSDDLDQTDLAGPVADEDELGLSLEEDEEDEANKALAGEDQDESEVIREEFEELTELEIEDLVASGGKEDAAAENAASSDDANTTAIRGGKDVSKLFDEDSPTVESIVMEGEMFGDALDVQNRQNARATTTFENVGRLDDTYSLIRGAISGGRRAGDPASHVVIASIVVLAVFLIAQIMHQSRRSLATYGAFNQTIGSIYRVIGKPVTPEWDIRGWRFEATNGNVDEEEDLLTIYSRIANKSNQALPYPLVHISLTDRWEDVIASRVLEPNDYLAGDLDPRTAVASGENFTAVITIESPSVDATGFRLSACYRISPGRVRCADEHFKD